MPGAVPTGLCKISAPLGSSACLRLLAVSVRPVCAAICWMRSQIAGRSSRGELKKFAIASVVRSSGVGPSPPVVRIKLERLAAISKA